MLIRGEIVSEPETRVDVDGRKFLRFELRETPSLKHGPSKGWFTVHAYIDQLGADLVSKGLISQVQGVISVSPYLDTEGRPRVRVIVFSEDVTPFQFEKESNVS